MIDIHTHILPGLDDGSPNLETSVEMARLAASCGTTDIVASPHADFEHTFDPPQVEAAIAQLTQVTGGLVRLHYGCDFHLHFDNVQRAVVEPHLYTINHKLYLLLELSDLVALKSTEEAIRRLMSAGVRPILTHPERNSLLRRRIDLLARWVEEGLYLQLTAQSLLGDFGHEARSAACQLLRAGLAHFIASDAHDASRRPPRLDQVRARIEEEFGDSFAARLLEEHPAAVIEGRLIPAGLVDVPKRRRWWSLLGS